MDLDPPRLRILELVAELDMDLKTVSLAIGRNHSYLQQFIKKGSPRTLPEDAREALGEHFGVDPDEFRPRRPRSSRKQASPPPQDDIVVISELDVRAAGGHGTIHEVTEAERVLADWRISKAVIRGQTTAEASRIKIITVFGDSMAPDFRPGERIMVDTEDRVPSPPGVFVIHDGLALVVKRVELVPYSDPPTIRLISKNPDYGEHAYPAEQVHVNGRVIGKWQWT